MQQTSCPDTTFRLFWRAVAGDNHLVSFKLKAGDTSFVDLNGRNWDNYSIPIADSTDYKDTAYFRIGYEDLIFTLLVTDASGLKDSAQISLDIQGAPILEFEDVILYEDGTTTPRYVDLYTGNTYSQDTAAYFSDCIDLGCIYNYVYHSIALGSPTSIAFKDCCTGEWPTRNSTTLDYTDYTARQFDELEDDLLMASVDSITRVLVIDFNSKDVLIFRTHDDKKGLIKLDTIKSHSIVMDIKIQE